MSRRYCWTTPSVRRWPLAALFIVLPALDSLTVAAQECIADPEINEFFATNVPTCCQQDVCGIPCPVAVEEPTKGFGYAIMVAILVSFFIGLATIFVVEGEAENFFIAGKSLPMWIAALSLGAQSIDSNAVLGNADLSYKYHFFDGAVLPFGLGLSLLLNGFFLAGHVNAEENVLTLPDILAKRYGRIPELLVSIATLVSFMMLLAGNLVGMAIILSYLWGISVAAGIWTAAILVWAYTICGGLFSVAYTDVAQVLVGWSGCVALTYYMLTSEDIKASPPSIGFPGYIYPDAQGAGGICDMYLGVPCTSDPSLCCYNSAFWCPSSEDCKFDNGAYPVGDQPIFGHQMSDYLALSPLPNALFWNWSTIFILGFGNLAALDFQARCIAAKTPSIATRACLIAGVVTFFVCIPLASLGAITRKFYGPDSIHAVFEADSCSTLRGLPTCGRWIPDDQAFVKFLTHNVPPILGGWCLFGVVAASMSTSDGAILAMGTVFAHNILRQFDVWYPKLVTAENLLLVTRLSTIPLTLAATFIAIYNPTTGYLLIVAFDVVLVTVVVPLFGCFYTKNPSPSAAFLSIISGALTRLVLDFVLPKDRSTFLPYGADEFLNYGPAASAGLPLFVDGNETDIWDADVESCDQSRFEDFSGVDSLTALFVSFVVFTSVQAIEHCIGKPILNFNGLQGYNKDSVARKECCDERVDNRDHALPTEEFRNAEECQESEEDQDSDGS